MRSKPRDVSVTGVSVVSDPGADQTYGIGDTISVQVTFNQLVVDVDTSGGTPRIKIDLDPAEWGEKWASYSSGSGTANLTFTHTVVEPNISTQGIAVLADTLELNGGTIRSDGADAGLAHTGLAHDANHKVDWQTESDTAGGAGGSDAEPASVTGVSVVSSAGADKTYGDGDTIQVRVTFDEAVDVTGSPRLKIDMDPAEWGEKWASYESGSGTSSLIFAHTVVEPNVSTQGIAVLEDTLELNSGTIRAGGADANLAHDGLAHDANHKVNWQTQSDTGAGGAGGTNGTSEPASVTGVSVVSDAGADETYGAGDTIQVRVAFTEAVDVTGSPRLTIDMDPAEWGEKRAVYESGSGTSSLTFAYTVAEPNISTQGIAVLANTLELNGGTIRSGGADAKLSHSGLGHDAKHKVDWRPEAVTVTGVSVVSDAGADKTYTLGDAIRIRVTFSEAVTVTGGPVLSIDMDPAEWGEKPAAYQSGSGTSSLTFAHTVVEPNYSTQGIAVLENTLELNGGTIRAGDADADLAHDGLGHDANHKVDWRPDISVADASASEAAGASVAFAVTLSRAFSGAEHRVTVDYATADGSATAGQDYTAASGTLTFAAGETSKTVNVQVLDDSHDEGDETFALRLSNAVGTRMGDSEATGTIENTDLMPAALLARFGRATAEQVVTHVEERMAAPRERGFRARFAGREFQPGQERDFALGFLSQFTQPMGMGAAGAAPMGMGGMTGMGMAGPTGMSSSVGAAGMSGMSGTGGMGGVGTGGMAGSMGMAGQQPMGYGSAGDAHGTGLFGTMLGYDPLANSEFELNRESRGGILSVWSRSSRSYFSGLEDALSLDGDVRTTMIGADYSRGALTMGLSVGRTLGLGGYSGPSGGQMSTSMTGFYPWAGYQVNDRVSVWGVTGYGAGALSLTPDGQTALETGVSMAMSAVGTRGELIGSRATGGFALAFKADALWVGAASDLLDGPTGRLNASEAGVTRVRTALEGSRGYTLGGGRLSLRPSVEVGLRRDGGDAETGAGMDVGGGLAFTDTVTGLSLDVRVRTLVVHQAEGFRESGMSLSLGWDPTPSSPLGLTARVAPSWGGQAQGGAQALWNSQMAYGMGSHQMYGAGDRVDAEVGYGLPVGARFVGTPRVGLSTSQYGRDYRVGYGLGVLEQGKVTFDLSAEAQRREAQMLGEASNGFMGRATLGW